MFRSMIEMIKKILIFPKYLIIAKKIRRDGCVVLVGTSTYNNLGDHLLSQNSIEFLSDYFSGKKLVEVPSQVFKRYEEKLSNVISDDAIVCISAGGWMGNLWPEDELLMQKMISTFSKHKIIIMPQTIFYDKVLDNYASILESANDTYDRCNDLTLFVRETNSFNVAKEILRIPNVYLVPDMGLYSKRNVEKRQCGYKALMCIRRDREANFNCDIVTELKDYLNSKEYSVDYFDTIEKHNVSNLFRKRHLEKLNRKLRSADIVFTDRLHGMIMAINCGCKCVAFDNKNHKVSGVYNTWLNNNQNVLLIDDVDNLDDLKIDELINVSTEINEWSNMIDMEFANMAKVMEGVIK